ncbi:hypothetical protein CNYM01_03324 [Colletotrichum nymphaeae SA-01]|uniref:Lumazine-binding protein n=1 Tax=Colletotrichum nymphaeae SA-01 TaxID=1460502 RepID=A0A135TQR5_9PEZI|nr:hypothetical protein CNYM01_03324 [Colletotrichum nymphaeae SA-01]
MSKNIKTIPTSEYDEVIKTVQHYVDSVAKADRVLLDLAFHKDATMTGWAPADGTLSLGSYTNLHAFFDTYGKSASLKTRCDVIGITPTTAVVKVDMENTPDGPAYTDFHTLIKVDGGWKIIAKVFHAYES